jgi:hypothetical protein
MVARAVVWFNLILMSFLYDEGRAQCWRRTALGIQAASSPASGTGTFRSSSIALALNNRKHALVPYTFTVIFLAEEPTTPQPLFFAASYRKAHGSRLVTKNEAFLPLFQMDTSPHPHKLTQSLTSSSFIQDY